MKKIEMMATIGMREFWFKLSGFYKTISRYDDINFGCIHICWLR